MSTVSENHWSTLEKFRGAADRMFQREVLPFPEKIASYDQVLAAGVAALEERGLDLSQEEQVFVVASVIAWMTNFITGLTASQCADPHVFAHLRESLQWPAFLVRELTLHVETPEEAK